jgi:hypothetical protein
MKKMNNSKWLKWIGSLGLLAALSCGAQAENLVKNGDFAAATNGTPDGWKPMSNQQTLAIDTTETTGDSKQSLRVDIGTDAGKSLGQIVQQISVTPYKKYRLKFDMKSSGEGTGIGQIKLQVGKSELKRIATGKSTTAWKTYTLDVDSGEANVILILLRYNQRDTNVGQKVWFANVSLEMTGDGAPPPPVTP